MENLLMFLPTIMKELMDDKGFWNIIYATAVSKVDACISTHTTCGHAHAILSAKNIDIWYEYFGWTADPTKIERWRAVLRENLLREMKRPENMQADKLVVSLDSNHYGMLEVTFILNTSEENAFEICLDAEEADGDKGGDGYGRD